MVQGFCSIFAKKRKKVERKGKIKWEKKKLFSKKIDKKSKNVKKICDRGSFHKIQGNIYLW